jgi:Na+/proline symporter
MAFPNNPHTVYNGMISGQRNMFLSSSVAVALIGFSNIFKDENVRLCVKILGTVIFIISICIGLKATDDFLFYLNNNKDEFPSYIPIDSWYSWKYISYIYSALLICVAMLFLMKKILSPISK